MVSACESSKGRPDHSLVCVKRNAQDFIMIHGRTTRARWPTNYNPRPNYPSSSPLRGRGLSYKTERGAGSRPRSTRQRFTTTLRHRRVIFREIAPTVSEGCVNSPQPDKVQVSQTAAQAVDSLLNLRKTKFAQPWTRIGKSGAHYFDNRCQIRK